MIRMVLVGRARYVLMRLLVTSLCASVILPIVPRTAFADAWDPPPGNDTHPLALHGHDVAVPSDALSSRTALPEASGDYRIDALLSGYRWPADWTTITYSFYDDRVFGGQYYGTATDVREVTEPVKANVRRIMAWFATLTNLDFAEVTETPGQIGFIRFMLTTETSYARAFYPTSTVLFHEAGDVHLNPDSVSAFEGAPGQYGYFILVHEIGHALGLKHSFEGDPGLPLVEDNDSHTAMSYTIRGDPVASPMPYDVMALQYLYGVRSYRAGADTYRFTAVGTDQYRLGQELYLDTSYRLRQTLWDAGGYNTLDLSGLPPRSPGYRIDLNGLGWLSDWASYGSTGTYFRIGTALAPNVQISAVVSSPSDDTLYAGQTPNAFGGYSRDRVTGADVIFDASSSDTINLTSFRRSDVTQTRDGNDLLLGLGASGSIRVTGYFTGNTPRISWGDDMRSLYLPFVARR